LLTGLKLGYHPHHKFRCGFAVYSLKYTKDISQLKAFSQNLMHANISITDGIYRGLSNSDINEQINSLTENQFTDDKDSLMDLVVKNRELIVKLEYKLNRDN
jgi:hypothetical protein